LLAADLLDEFLLQFLQPALDAVRRKGIRIDYGLGDAFLQDFQEGAFISKNLINSLNGNVLQNGFVYCPVGVAFCTGLFA